MPNIKTIRKSTTNEIPILQSIENDAALLFDTVPGYAYCIDIGSRSVEEHTEVLEHGVSLVAVDTTDTIMGFALIRILDRRPHLLELAVAQKHQGKGTGRLLVQSAAQWAKQNNYDDITLTTFRDIPWNMPWYKRLGFVEFIPGPDRPELISICAHENDTELGEQARVAMIKQAE